MIAGFPLLLTLAIVASPAADEHLLAGAGAFRDGRFDAALVEFRVAEALGADGARAYAAAALVQLGRHEEALEAFASSPDGEDDLLEWYRALACYGARLYVCAERTLSGLDAAGPRAAAEAGKVSAEIARALAPGPSEAAIGWYAARCEQRRAEGRAQLAAAYCREAADLRARAGAPSGVARTNGSGAHARLPPTDAGSER